MIVIKFMGGLGNQMFQYAFGKVISDKLKLDFKLDISDYESDPLRTFELQRCFNLNEKIASREEVKKAKRGFLSCIPEKLFKLANLDFICKSKVYLEPSFNYVDLSLFSNKETYYSGYWQSEKYFSVFEKEIRTAFQFSKPLSATYQDYKKQIEGSTAVSVHVRRGDYISSQAVNSFHGTCSQEYYLSAIDVFQNKIENVTFYIFSDDMVWCLENFKGKANVVFVQKSDLTEDWEDLYLMSLCNHNIIANSSFSWWAAWLNNYADKLVIAPENWFVDSSIDTSDLIPNSWLRV